MSTRTLIRGGCVLTLGTRTPNHAEADVLIEDDRIVEVGSSLRSRDAEEIDATDTIVMPGFVDTHRHTWRTLVRNLGDRPGAPPSPAVYGPHHGADDIYAATLAGLLGAVEAGITTVVDWADIPPDLVDAALQAHADAGIRGVFVRSAPAWGDGDDDLSQVLARGTRPGPATTGFAAGSRDVAAGSADGVAQDWAAARDRGLHVHAHAGMEASGRGAVADLGARGLLGADVTLVHCTTLDGADLGAIVASGVGVSVTPSTEMATGLGPPPIAELVDRGIRPGLGVDDERLAPGDLFAQMRAVISLHHAAHFQQKLVGKAGLSNLMTTREAIRHGTVDGARSVGLGALTGSLEPGKQADIVVLRTDRPNIFPINDPIGAVVWGMDTSNIDWVFVAGKALVRNGALEADTARTGELVREAQARVSTAAGLIGEAVAGGAQ